MFEVARSHRTALVVLLGCFGTTAHAQDFCSESNRCTYTIGSPGRFATIVPRRLLFTSGMLVWASAVDVHVLDLGTGRARTLPHCGTAITDLALEGSYVYVLADHALLCRTSLTSTPSVQMLVSSPDTVVDGFAVSSAAFAYAMRHYGGQPEVHMAQWGNGQWRTFPTTVTVEHIVVDDVRAYWIDADYLVSVALATGVKTVGPRIANHVTRMQVAHGVVYVATDHDVVRLDSAGRSWITVAVGRADDLAVDGVNAYSASTSRGTITKLGTTPTQIGSWNKPYALALDATTLFVVEDDPFVIKQIAPR
jgi:hypothetical protein